MDEACHLKQAREDAIADTLSECLAGDAADVIVCNIGVFELVGTDLIVARKEGGAPEVVAFGDELIEDGELPFVVHALAEFINGEDFHFDKREDNGGVAFALIELKSQ